MEKFKHLLLWGFAAVGALGLIIVLLFIARAYFVPTYAPSPYALEEVGYSARSVTSLSGVDSASSFMMADEAIFESEASYAEPVTLQDGTVVDAKIIKTGSLELVVDEVDATSDEVARIAEEHDGYVENVRVYERGDGSREGVITIRVPIEQFETVMEGVMGYANVVEQEHISADDITEDYVDILARLNNAIAQEERYLAILQRADSVEDILSVERELNTIRETIERYQGQINYYDSQTSLSTITVTLSEEPTIEIAGKEFRPGTTVKLAAQALVAFGQWLINATIWLVIFGGGVLIPLGLLIWLIQKAIRTRKKK